MELAKRLADIQSRMGRACTRADRAMESVKLMAVSKTHPPATVDAAVDVGLILFGENRVQEARAKIPQCSARATWHMIGHLQSNKVRPAVELFSMIEGVDSVAIAREISKRAGQADRTMPVLMEVNVGGEASKSGFQPDLLLSELKDIQALPHIQVQGLMTVPPWKPTPEQVRPFFLKARELKKQCEDLLGEALPHLSMGMSGDFEVAIEEGATIVRVGTALFGERPKPMRQHP